LKVLTLVSACFSQDFGREVSKNLKVSKILTILTCIDSLKFGLVIDPIDMTDSN
jgi:hypothetical protein